MCPANKKEFPVIFCQFFCFFLVTTKNLNKRSVIYHATEKMRARGSRVTFYFTSNNFFSLHFYFNDRPKKNIFSREKCRHLSKKEEKKTTSWRQNFCLVVPFQKKFVANKKDEIFGS
jgi:hypothetical protein